MTAPNYGVNLEPVAKSSNVAAIGYAAKTNRLIVMFKNGGTYAYDNVPWSTYEALRTSASKGTFVREVLVAQPKDFPCTRLDDGHGETSRA